MLNILHTESSDGWGGQEARTVLEAEHFVRRGHRVRIAGPPNSGIAREAHRRGIPFVPIPIRSVMDLKGWYQLCRLLRHEQPTILHTHSSKDSWLAGLAGKQAGIPALIRTRHVSIPVHAHRLNLVYRIPDRIIVTASVTRNHLVKQYGLNPDRVVTLPTGVDLNKFGPHISGKSFREEFGLGKTTPLVGIIAQFRGSKGHNIFIEAAKILSDQNPKIRFFIVGDGLWRDLIREKVKQEGMADRIHLTGYREDIPSVMAALDVMVIASIRTDGIPQAGLQAMATGVPLVGTNVGGIPEILRNGKTGFLVPPGDAFSLADAIRHLLSDPTLRKQLGTNGIELVREYHSLENMLDTLERIYEDTLRSTMGIRH